MKNNILSRIKENRLFKDILKIAFVITGCLVLASYSPSLDGRAIVVEPGVFPEGLFAKTVGYLPGDIISVTNITGETTVDLLVIGALDPSEGVAIMLSPEAADAIGISRNSNNIVKITKRSNQDERVYGSAVIAAQGTAGQDNKKNDEEIPPAVDKAPESEAFVNETESQTFEEDFTEEAVEEEPEEEFEEDTFAGEGASGELALQEEAENIEALESEEEIYSTPFEEEEPVVEYEYFEEDEIPEMEESIQEAEHIPSTEDEVKEESFEDESLEEEVYEDEGIEEEAFEEAPQEAEEVEEEVQEENEESLEEEEEAFEEETVEYEEYVDEELEDLDDEPIYTEEAGEDDIIEEEIEDVEDVEEEAVEEEVEEFDEEVPEEEASEEEFEDEAIEEEYIDEEEIPEEEAVEEEFFDAEEPEVLEEEIIEEEPEEEAEEEDFEEEDFEEETEDFEALDEEAEDEVVEEEVEEEIPEEEVTEEEVPEETEVLDSEEEVIEEDPSMYDDEVVVLEDEEAEEDEEEYDAIVLIPAEDNPPIDLTNLNNTIGDSFESDEEVIDITDELVIEENEINETIENSSIVIPAANGNESSYEKFMVESLNELAAERYYIQIATLRDDENILEIVNRYGQKYPITIVPAANGAKQVLVGPVTLDEYGTLLARFKAYGYKDAFLRKGTNPNPKPRGGATGSDAK